MSSNNTYERYSRQVALKEFGEAAQRQLLQAKVLMIGAGGLGCAALQYLAAAGVGELGIVDNDVVALNNLHRQTLYNTEDIGLSKAKQAAAFLSRLNPEIVIEAFHERLTVANALVLIEKYDIIIDGTDNFSSRYMINDACVLLNKPLVYGAVSRFEGQVAIFNYNSDNKEMTVNYRDLFPAPPAPGEVANCAEAGVLGVLPGIIGSMQAIETIKLITGIGLPLVNKLFTYNALNNRSYELALTAQAATRGLVPADDESFMQTDYDWLCGVTTETNQIDTAAFNRLIKEKDVLIADVREYGEPPAVSEFEHIQIPLSSIADTFPDTENKTIIVFCQSGKRSVQAAKLLAARFGESKEIFSLTGGILQWKQEQKL